VGYLEAFREASDPGVAMLAAAQDAQQQQWPESRRSPSKVLDGTMVPLTLRRQKTSTGGHPIRPRMARPPETPGTDGNVPATRAAFGFRSFSMIKSALR
jgi:hypothetical protein